MQMNCQIAAIVLACIFFSFTTKTFTGSNNKLVGFSDTSIIADGVTLQLVSRQFSFTEGPAVDRRGNVFFTDQPNNKIWKYDVHGKLSLFMDDAGRPNGMYFDKRGNLLTCADENNQLWSISKRKKIKVLVNDLNGKKLNGPNDLWVASNGDIYFTDPYYQRPYWKRTKPDMEKQNVYLLPHGTNSLITVIEDIKQPNGIVGTPDGKYLYVADIGGSKTFRYTITSDGSLSNRQLFTDSGSDGMTMDNKGNLYLTGNGVTVFDAQGKQIAHIPVPEEWTSNVAFGGRHRDELFITASEGVYSLKMKVCGVE
jgi:gluconolactonase